jgi:hypothetical protein
MKLLVMQFSPAFYHFQCDTLSDKDLQNHYVVFYLFIIYLLIYLFIYLFIYLWSVYQLWHWFILYNFETMLSYTTYDHTCGRLLILHSNVKACSGYTGLRSHLVRFQHFLHFGVYVNKFRHLSFIQFSTHSIHFFS